MRRTEISTELACLAEDQAGVVSRAQLRAAGLGPDVVRRRVGSGRWRTVGPTAVVLHGGPVDAAARRWVALVDGGPAAALAAWSALAVQGLEGWERPRVHVVLPAGRSRPSPDGVVHHVSRRCREEDVVLRSSMRVHRVERAAVDAASWTTAPRAAGGLLAAVVQQRLSTPARLQTALDGAGAVRHRRELASVLAELAGGSQAMSEVDLVRLCRRNGLPVPVRQAVREDGTGRRRYLDAEWALEGGRRLVLEVDGTGHLDPSRWYDDLLRAAETGDRGDLLLRIPARALRLDEARVVAVLRRHLSTR
ncbi:hypothetical protein WDZ17_11285 [Pseudokineococcus basanitobsidens]|uniref:DUF559 domain-containing protein n=1 Tax=Pseudokineococcus basanitobsidens TaxID=1926649 RepID=A0ABU8RLE7_9ACTN